MKNKRMIGLLLAGVMIISSAPINVSAEDVDMLEEEMIIDDTSSDDFDDEFQESSMDNEKGDEPLGDSLFESDYKVTWYAGEGEISSEYSDDPVEYVDGYVEGENIRPFSDQGLIAPENKVFKGWSSDGTESGIIDFEDYWTESDEDSYYDYPISSDLVFTAIWEPEIGSYEEDQEESLLIATAETPTILSAAGNEDENENMVTITLNANGVGHFNVWNSETQQFVQTQEYSYTQEKGSVFTGANISYEANGYISRGWGRTADADATEALPFDYDLGGFFTLTEDVTLYVIWSEEVIITLNANNGGYYNTYNYDTQMMESTQEHSMRIAKGEVFKGANINPEANPGKYLKGWGRTADATEVLPYDSNLYGYFTITEDVTLYAIWGETGNPYNMGDETYSFENFSDTSSDGHCFGMSMTSAGYYNDFLDIEKIGGNKGSSLYSFSKSKTVIDPICYYQSVQGSYSNIAIVAGGSWYLYNTIDAPSDWREVVNYVKSHKYDNTGLLQIGFRGVWYDRDNTKCEGGHAINFLRYENVNGQDRIYAYDNNFPNQETYFYQDANGSIIQTPQKTFSKGPIICIALRDVRKYFEHAAAYDITHVLYLVKEEAEIPGYDFYYMDGISSISKYVMYEIPANQNSITIIPKKDNARFRYMNKEYSFGKVANETYATLDLASPTDGAKDLSTIFTIHNTSENSGNQTNSEIGHTETNEKSAIPREKITISKIPFSVKAKAKKNKVTVSWKKIKKNKAGKKLLKQIKSIQVQYSTDPKFKQNVKTKTVGKKKTKVTLKLQKKTTYYVRVRYKGSNGFSKWSKDKKVKTKK